MQYTNKLVALGIMVVVSVTASADAVDDLIATLTGDDNEARMTAAKNAGSAGAGAIEPLGALAASDDYLVVRAARLALERVVAAAGVPGADANGAVPKALLKLAQPGQPAPTRREAIFLLGWIGGPDNVAAIADLLSDPDIADSARMALQRIPGEEVAEALLAAAPKVDDAVLPGVFYVVANRNDQDAVPILIGIARGGDREKAWMAFDVLTRLGIAPTNIIPRSATKDLSEGRRYANGFLRAADTMLAQGKRVEAERVYASVASFPASPQHACAALIGLKNAQSSKLIEHALGYLLERDISQVAQSTLINADLDGLDDYLIRAYAVTNPAKQHALLKIIGARNPEGADRFLNEARHNESPMVRFTAARVLGDIPSPETFEAAFANAPANIKDELANAYFKLAVDEHRSGNIDSAKNMAHSLAVPLIEPRIREGAFGIIEAAASPESAPLLREMIGSAYQSKDESEAGEDLFDGVRGLAIAAGRAYVAVHAAAAKDDPEALEEIANVSENAFNAEVSNFAEEKLKELVPLREQTSSLERFIDDGNRNRALQKP